MAFEKYLAHLCRHFNKCVDSAHSPIVALARACLVEKCVSLISAEDKMTPAARVLQSIWADVLTSIQLLLSVSCMWMEYFLLGSVGSWCEEVVHSS